MQLARERDGLRVLRRQRELQPIAREQLLLPADRFLRRVRLGRQLDLRVRSVLQSGLPELQDLALRL